MTSNYTNLIRIPGIAGRVVIDADYNWAELGELLSAESDRQQAIALDSFAQGLRELRVDGIMQLQYLADVIKGNPDQFDKQTILWMLEGLSDRLRD